jgi:OmpA-OmpF porin, OOP family
MTKKWMAAMLGAAAMALSTGALAQMSPSFYAGVELGSSDLGSETDTAMKIFGGFQFHPNIAVELGYGFLYDKGATEVTALELVGVGMYQVAPQLSVLGKLGFASVEVDVGGFSDDKVELVFGVGAQYDVMRNLSARLMFTRYNTSDAVDVISVAALWRF